MLQKFLDTAPLFLQQVGTQIFGAVLILVIGRWLISMVLRLVSTGMNRRHIDPTLVKYALSTLTGLLNIVLIVSVIGAFGVQTATFAALFASVGIAIGMAMSGLLSNFAAGIFLVVLRPYHVGDFIHAGGVTGTVVEIGPFATTIDTPDNVKTIVGNGKIFGDNILNYTTNPFRRVELETMLGHGVDFAAVQAGLKSAIQTIPNVATDPGVDVEIVGFKPEGIVVAIRPYCHNKDYWQVYFDTTRAIQATIKEQGWPGPVASVLYKQS